MSKGGYIGKIKNNGAQTVKAPVDGTGSKGKPATKSGGDLRGGK